MKAPIKLSELRAALYKPGRTRDRVTMCNSVASANAAGLEQLTVGTDILGSVVRQASQLDEFAPVLLEIAEAALAIGAESALLSAPIRRQLRDALAKVLP